MRKTLLTYWNTVAFQSLYARTAGWTPSQGAPAVAERPLLDRWLLPPVAVPPPHGGGAGRLAGPGRVRPGGTPARLPLVSAPMPRWWPPRNGGSRRRITVEGCRGLRGRFLGRPPGLRRRGGPPGSSPRIPVISGDGTSRVGGADLPERLVVQPVAVLPSSPRPQRGRPCCAGERGWDRSWLDRRSTSRSRLKRPYPLRDRSRVRRSDPS